MNTRPLLPSPLLRTEKKHASTHLATPGHPIQLHQPDHTRWRAEGLQLRPRPCPAIPPLFPVLALAQSLRSKRLLIVTGAYVRQAVVRVPVEPNPFTTVLTPGERPVHEYLELLRKKKEEKVIASSHVKNKCSQLPRFTTTIRILRIGRDNQIIRMHRLCITYGKTCTPLGVYGSVG